MILTVHNTFENQRLCVMYIDFGESKLMMIVGKACLLG